jgi:hypothetical protein
MDLDAYHCGTCRHGFLIDNCTQCETQYVKGNKMAEYDNTNRGVLFTNDRKESDRHPDMKGSININGVEHWFDGWWKSSAKGEFLSLSIGKPKDSPRTAPAAPVARRGAAPTPTRSQAPARAPAPAPRAAPAPVGFDAMDDDVPW